MRLEILGGWKLPHFDVASLRVEGHLLLGCYIALFLVVLYLRRSDFGSLRGRRLVLFLALLLLTVLLNNVIWLRFPATNVLPPPEVPSDAPAPSVPLFGSVGILLTGALFGAGPAMITGLVAGLVRGGVDSSRVFAPFELATFGLIVGFLLHQAYRGRIWRLLRQPVVAALFGAGFLWALLWVGVYASTSGSSLSALDYTRSLLLASVVAVALDGLFGGMLIQGLYVIVPKLRPRVTSTITPPHLRSMNRRLLTALIPLALLMVVAMFTAVTTAAIREATNQALDGMIQRASNASEMTPFLFNTGQELLQNFASDAQLRSDDLEMRQRVLDSYLKIGLFGPFFSQLILVDGAGKVINTYPEDSSLPELSTEEEELLQRTLKFGSPERSHVFAAGDGHMISFIAPVLDNDEQPHGALVGRTQVSINPTVASILSPLRGPEGTDSGFIVDERGLIAFHPDEQFLLTPRSVDLACPDISGNSEQGETQTGGKACRDLAPDGTQRLIYYLPVAAMGNWTVVITYPYQAVLERATRNSGQLLLILLVVTGLLAVTVIWITGRLTRPLQVLAIAAHSIAAGQLDDQVTLTGEDEVAQLGGAFEQMRLSLKDRLDDLSLLLRVSQTVSSDLDMTKGIRIILDGALQATDARFARLILLDDQGDPQVVMTREDRSGHVTALDRAMVRLGRRRNPVKIENVAEVRGLIDPNVVGPNIQALIVVPMRSPNRDVGVMWLGYDHAYQVSHTEVDFLSTLASQAAVAVENARLFQAAEGGRRRLSAILESTSDSVIVTDDADRVLLLNPAAAGIFGTNSKAVSGMPIAEAVPEQKVIDLLTAPMNDGVPLTGEVPLPDGRTLYGSASVIVSGEGQTIGRVAVLRDITYLKELDEIKSEFVATVSHDLRAPLTFMRGYATMIPMVGQVSAKQKRYVDKIMVGIEQMTELIDDLLDLGRIEAGIGLMRAPCRLDDIIVGQVDAMQPQAKAKGLTLRLDRTEDVTVVVGDASLLPRVIANLVDNAIKYTPESGEVTVNWATLGNRVLISVADTGIGIAKVDQVHLFEKFSRIKRRETVNIKGSGLGLAIVKSIVGWHNGRVWVESELGKGSTFYVELPIGELDEFKD
jgi:PAS domain S-box-containing protein